MDATQCYVTIKTVFMKTLNDRGKIHKLKCKGANSSLKQCDINPRKMHIKKERNPQILDVYRLGCWYYKVVFIVSSFLMYWSYNPENR